MSTAAPAPRPYLLTVSEVSALGILVAASLFLPFIVHLLPLWGDDSWGQRLLPIFYAPLIAALRYRLPLAVLVAALPPWLNHLFTGRPVVDVATLLSVELLCFVLVVFGARMRLGTRFWYGPPGYVLAALMGACFLWWTQLWPVASPLRHAWGNILTAAPGIAILAVIGYLALRVQPPKAA